MTPGNHRNARFHAVWPNGGSGVEFSEDGRFVLKLNGNGGTWERDEEWKGMLLRPDAGGELWLEEEEWGYAAPVGKTDGMETHRLDARAPDTSIMAQFALVRTEAEFAGFWHDFDPRHPLSRPLTGCPWRITSPYGNLDAIRNGEEWDAVISGENTVVTVEEDGRMRWEFGGRWGRTRRFIGTPEVDSPMALHVPHFYDYWGRLGDWRPERRKAEAGISFLAANLGQPGSLAARRLEIAQALSRWFTVAIPPRLKELFPCGARLKTVEVPRTPRAKYDFVSGFTFNLCFENSWGQGYLTEKPFDALISGAVPLYEGDPAVGEWIDPSAMIQCSGLEAEEIADRIRGAERDGTVERVHAEREGLIAVSLEEMIRRVERFCAQARGAEGNRSPKI